MASSDTLQELVDLTLQFREDRNWGQWHSPKNVAISLALEAAEVLDHVKWYDDETLMARFADNPEEIAEELMDVLHNVFILCSELDIDIPDAYRRKMRKNEKKYPVRK